MRANLMVSVLGCALAGAITASTAAMADWHSPYFYRETNGSWTNVTYDDGICRYRYSHNTYDNQPISTNTVIARESRSVQTD